MNVKSIHNISNVTVPVETETGTTFLPPRAGLTNVNVKNMNEVKKTCHVVENLNEVTGVKKAGRING